MATGKTGRVSPIQLARRRDGFQEEEEEEGEAYSETPFNYFLSSPSQSREYLSLLCIAITSLARYNPLSQM